MSYKLALTFDRWKAFSENYKPMRIWLWFIYKFTENYCCFWLFFAFIQTQKRYPTFLDKIKYLNLKTTSHIKLKFFWWTNLLESLVLAKYLISVAATLKGISKYLLFLLKLYLICCCKDPIPIWHNMDYFTWNISF